MNNSMFDDYFDEMDLSDTEKAEREDLAFWIYLMMLLTFSLIDSMIENESVDKDYAKKSLKENYEQLISEHVSENLLDSHILDYVLMFATNEINVTMKYLDSAKPNDKTDSYYLSSDRALNIGANEANTILNYRDYKNAIENGYTKKQWISENDKHVRTTHRDINGTILDINEPFVIKDSLLMFPKDTSLGAEPDEIVNCRCTIKYIK